MEAMEGRLLAHRRILQLLVKQLGATPAGEELVQVLRERSTLQDGQEDPGAVETLGLGLELATADEYRQIVEDLPLLPGAT